MLGAAASGQASEGAAVATSAGGYRLCNDPDKQYLVVAVRRTPCKRAGRIAREYFGRLYDLRPGDWHRVFGFRCTRAKSGIYFGLFGSRAYCRKGKHRVRFESRGE